MANRPHWSYSAISQYLACPLRFYFQRVLCLPQPSIGSSLVLGSSVHAALATYHRALQKNDGFDEATLKESFTSTWSRNREAYEISFRDGESESSSIDQGIALVELYVRDVRPTNIVSVETSMMAPLHNSRGEILETPLLIVADLVTAQGENFTIRELKTSGRAYSGSEIAFSLQPTCYVNALHEATGRLADVEFTVLVKTKTPKLQRLCTNRSTDDLARLGDIVQNIERSIAANVFYPVENPLNCSTCPYRQPCREWGRPDNYYGIERPLAIVTQGAEC